MLIVTGGTGQVGEDLIRLLREKDVNHAFISRNDGISGEKSLRIKRDLSIPDLDWGLIQKSVTGIVHLAAAVPHTSEFPDDSQSALITETIDDNIINLQKQTGAPLIYMSGCGLYSKFSDHFHTEQELTPIAPRTPYFAAKYRGEKKASEVPNSVILRLSAPVPSNLKKDVVLTKMLQSARRQGLISVYGRGTREQDFILTRDVSNSIIQILDHEVYGLFNLCSSNPVTMLQLAESIARKIPGIEVRIGEKEDENEGHRARYDNSKLKNSIDFKITTNIDAMIDQSRILAE